MRLTSHVKHHPSGSCDVQPHNTSPPSPKQQRKAHAQQSAALDDTVPAEGGMGGGTGMRVAATPKHGLGHLGHGGSLPRGLRF